MIYALIIAFLAGLTMGGAGAWQWKEGQIARHEQAQAAAQMEIDEAARQARVEAANKIIDMEAAYIAGESNAKTIVQKVYVKGQSYVSSQPVFQNPACVVPADGMLAVNRARAGMRAPADPGEPAPSVPAAGADQGRAAGNAVPASPSGHGAVGGVPATPSVPSGVGQVPGSSVRPVPKPKPAT
jgi:hypothetical protein